METELKIIDQKLDLLIKEIKELKQKQNNSTDQKLLSISEAA